MIFAQISRLSNQWRIICCRCKSTAGSSSEVRNGQSSEDPSRFVFNRKRSSKPDIPKEFVTVLSYPFKAPPTPPNENEHEFKLAFSEAKVYLVATSHTGRNSGHDVSKTVRAVQPDVVAVEFCENRAVKQLKLLNDQVQTHDGHDIRAAIEAPQSVPGCRLVLYDRLDTITWRRFCAATNFRQKLRYLSVSLTWGKDLRTNKDIDEARRGRRKDTDIFTSGEFPELTRVWITERDLYMTHMLHFLLQDETLAKRSAMKTSKAKWQPVAIVAVMGAYHVPGVIANWRKSIDIEPLTTVPKETLAMQLQRYLLNICMIFCRFYVRWIRR